MLSVHVMIGGTYVRGGEYLGIPPLYKTLYGIEISDLPLYNYGKFPVMLLLHLENHCKIELNKQLFFLRNYDCSGLLPSVSLKLKITCIHTRYILFHLFAQLLLMLPCRIPMINNSPPPFPPSPHLSLSLTHTCTTHTHTHTHTHAHTHLHTHTRTHTHTCTHTRTHTHTHTHMHTHIHTHTHARTHTHTPCFPILTYFLYTSSCVHFLQCTPRPVL